MNDAEENSKERTERKKMNILKKEINEDLLRQICKKKKSHLT